MLRKCTRPFRVGGGIRYEIEYEPARIPGDPASATGIRTRFYTLSLRIGALSYNVRVVAVNNQGRASSSILVVNCTGSERGTIATVDVHFLTSFVFDCFFSEPVPIYTCCFFRSWPSEWCVCCCNCWHCCGVLDPLFFWHVWPIGNAIPHKVSIEHRLWRLPHSEHWMQQSCAARLNTKCRVQCVSGCHQL